MMQRTFPLVLTLVIGLMMTAEFFIPHWAFARVKDYITNFGLIIATAAFLLGIINLLQVNLPIVRERRQDWPYKLIMIVAMAGMLLLSALSGSEREGSDLAEAAWRNEGILVYLLHGAVPWGVDGAPITLYSWVYKNLFQALNATMFALLAFYVASAAFRAFRARNFEATLLLVSAVLIMFFRIPIGEMMVANASEITAWIMTVPNNAARRAIFIGSALGVIATGLRVVLGIERSHLGGEG